jgi:hypothetical protein
MDGIKNKLNKSVDDMLEKASIAPWMRHLGVQLGSGLGKPQSSMEDVAEEMDQDLMSTKPESIFSELLTGDEPIVIHGNKIKIGNFEIDKEILLRRPEMIPPYILEKIRSKLSRKVASDIIDFATDLENL